MKESLSVHRLYRMLDSRIATLQCLSRMPDLPEDGTARLHTAIWAWKWMRAEIALLAADEPLPLTPEQHWRAEDAYQDEQAERAYRAHVEGETD